MVVAFYSAINGSWHPEHYIYHYDPCVLSPDIFTLLADSSCAPLVS